MRKLIIKRPKGWRKGQTIFNFLEFIRKERGIHEAEENQAGRMADPFYISDEEMMKYWKDFMKKYGN